MTKIILLILLTSSGCVFYRHDIKSDYDSITAWTLFKNFNIIIDPNGITYDSSSKDVKVITPYAIGETK